MYRVASRIFWPDHLIIDISTNTRQVSPMKQTEMERLRSLLEEAGFEVRKLEGDAQSGFQVEVNSQSPLILPITWDLLSYKDPCFRVIMSGAWYTFLAKSPDEQYLEPVDAPGDRILITHLLYNPTRHKFSIRHHYPCISMTERSGFSFVVRRLAGNTGRPDYFEPVVVLAGKSLFVGNSMYPVPGPEVLKSLRLDPDNADDKILGTLYVEAKRLFYGLGAGE